MSFEMNVLERIWKILQEGFSLEILENRSRRNYHSISTGGRSNRKIECLATNYLYFMKHKVSLNL